MSLEFSFKDFVEVMIPERVRLWIRRFILLGIPTAVAAVLIAYTIVRGG